MKLNSMVDPDRIRLLILLPGVQLFGQEQALIGLARLLRTRGIESRFLLHAGWGNPLAEQLEKEKFDYSLLPMGTLWSIRLMLTEPMSQVGNLWSAMRTTVALRRIMKQENFSHIVLGNSTFALYLLPALFNKKIAVVYRHGDEPTLHSWFHRWMTRILFSRSDRHVTNCWYIAKSILSLFPDADPVVIYNTPARLEPSESNECATPGADNGAPALRRLLYVGQVAEHKGILVLLEAFRLLAPEFPDVVLDIVGEIPGVGACRPLHVANSLNAAVADYPDRIFHHGHQNDVSAYYQRAHLHICPSIWQDPSPNVIFEAKQYGLPSVVFNVGGVPELVAHREDGFICQNISASELAAGIRCFLADESLRTQAALSARQSIGNKFGNQRFIEQWLEVLRTTGCVAQNA